MNWIKSNPFVAGLAGVTVLLCGILYFLASEWGTRYEEAKFGFDDSYSAVSAAERTPLYPTPENRAGKTKALTEHRQAVDELSGLFAPYRPEAVENISPQAFTDRLISGHQEVTAAFGNAKTELPENFFLGFEGYRNQLAQSGATGTLLLQLDGIKRALTGLADARPSALLKVFRAAAVEENGGTYQPAPNDVARYFPFEITFRGSEQSVREFLSSLGSTDSHYFVVRTIHIQNERNTPPKVADAKFEETAPAAADPAPADNPFGAFFPDAADGDAVDEAPGGDEDAPAEEAGAAPQAPPAAEADSSRILAQVLGSEELIVFVRFDLAVFLPAKELPKP